MAICKSIYALLLFVLILIFISGSSYAATIDITGLQIEITKVLVASEVDAQMNPAKPTGKFIYISFTVSNRTKVKRTLTRSMFSVVYKDGETYVPTDSALASIQSPESKPLTSVNLLPGASGSFIVAYDIPAACDLTKAKLRIQPSKNAAAWYESIDVSHIY